MLPKKTARASRAYSG